MECIDQSIQTRVVNNLSLYDMDGTLHYTIPVVYAQRNWPFAREDSPDYEANLKNRLRNTPFEFVKRKIAQIIGTNCPTILKPRELLEIPDSDTFLTKHNMGWALNGPVCIGQKKHGINRIKCINEKESLETQTKDLFKRDFEKSKSIKEFSRDDIRWENIVKKSI